MNLSSISKNKVYKIVKINIIGFDRLLDFGIFENTEVKLDSINITNTLNTYLINGSIVGIRNSVAKNIEVVEV